MMRTAVFKLSGQPDSGPMGVLDQSRARIKEPISPPPENTVAAAEVGSAVAVSAGSLTAFNELTGSRWLLVYGDRRGPGVARAQFGPEPLLGCSNSGAALLPFQAAGWKRFR